jgi:immunity protein 53 of polymorphic toxin system
MSTLARLEQWYLGNCDGDWEHEFGIRIDTLDNPGWSFDVSLEGTKLEEIHFEPVRIERSESEWIHCFTKEGKFKVRCGPRNLEEGIIVFLEWADRSSGVSK